MRSKDYGKIAGLSEKFSKEETLEMFRRACLCHYFEFEVKRAYEETTLIKMPVYLSAGKEFISAALSVAVPDAYKFDQHRCHDTYLASGGNVEALIDELLHRSSGCAKGMGGSASIHSPATKMFGTDGFIGTEIPIATGFAFDLQRRGEKEIIIALMGDGAAEEDWVLSSLGFIGSKKLPMLIVCGNNNLSVLTKIKVRRNWELTKVAESFGIPAIEITDDPWLIMHHAKRLKKKLPALMDIHYCRWFWHAGAGIDGAPEWDRFDLTKQELSAIGLGEKAEEIEKEIEKYLKNLWKEKTGGMA